MKRKRVSGNRNGNRRINQSDRICWEDIESTFNSRIRTGCITNIRHIDLTQFLNDARSMFVRRIKKILASYRFVKVWFTFCGEFIKASCSSSDVKDFKYINTKTRVISLDDNLNECNVINYYY